MTAKELEAQLAAMRAENEALKAKIAKGTTLRLKVSEKGGLSLYGINSRFPVTLYRQQWEKLIAYAPTITQFIADNADKLSVKASS